MWYKTKYLRIRWENVYDASFDRFGVEKSLYFSAWYFGQKFGEDQKATPGSITHNVLI